MLHDVPWPQVSSFLISVLTIVGAMYNQQRKTRQENRETARNVQEIHVMVNSQRTHMLRRIKQVSDELEEVRRKLEEANQQLAVAEIDDVGEF